jgi:hypothetical protein
MKRLLVAGLILLAITTNGYADALTSIGKGVLKPNASIPNDKQEMYQRDGEIYRNMQRNGTPNADGLQKKNPKMACIYSHPEDRQADKNCATNGSYLLVKGCHDQACRTACSNIF